MKAARYNIIQVSQAKLLIQGMYFSLNCKYVIKIAVYVSCVGYIR